MQGKTKPIPFVEPRGDHYEMIIYKDNTYIEHDKLCDCKRNV